MRRLSDPQSATFRPGFVRLCATLAAFTVTVAFLGAPAVAAAPAQTSLIVLRADGGDVDVDTVEVRVSDLPRILDRLDADPEVLAAEPDRPVWAAAAKTDDVYRPMQWAFDRLGGETLWDRTTGAGVIVAVIDSGVDGTHPDLAGAVLPGRDLVSSGDGRTDPNGHGTLVAGLIAAVPNNKAGITGLAPGARILPVRVLDTAGAGSTSAVAEGVLWAADQGADVINLSLGGDQRSTVLAGAINYAVAAGVTVVVASGNSGAAGNPVMWPAAEPNVIAVGATAEKAETRAAFSSYGPYVDIAAPGERVISTAKDGSYALASGTSFAAPLVAAAAAAVRAAHPELTPAEVSSRLTSTADDLGVAGRDDQFGFGMVSPVKAAGAAAPKPTPAPSTPTPTTPKPDPESPGPSVARRVATSPSVRDQAHALSSEFFEAASAPVVVVARDDAFADSLAGAPLTRGGAPLLLVQGGPLGLLDFSVRNEIRRVLAPGGTVYILGGTSAVSTVIEWALAAEFDVERIAGDTRALTALAVAAEMGPADTVLLAREDRWADAITAGAYGAKAGVPVLLTASDQLSAPVAAYLAAHRLDVTILGGPAAISQNTENQVRALARSVQRVAGSDRAGTAVEVARRLWGRVVADDGDQIVMIEGYGDTSWAAALAASSVAAQLDAPQLLGHGAAVTSASSAYLSGLGYGPDNLAAVLLVGPTFTDDTAADVARLMRGH